METANHIAHIIFVFYSAVKTHLLTNQKAHTIETILKKRILSGFNLEIVVECGKAKHLV